MTKPTFEDAVREYEELKLSIKESNERLDVLRPIIEAGLEPDQILETEHGNFTLRKRSVWEYSHDTKQLAKTLKERQNEEQATGVAQEQQTFSLVYTQEQSQIDDLLEA